MPPAIAIAGEVDETGSTEPAIPTEAQSLLTSYASEQLLVNGVAEYLTKKFWPVGLQKLLLNELTLIPMRYFISDDSGTMMFPDGHKIKTEGESAK